MALTLYAAADPTAFASFDIHGGCAMPRDIVDKAAAMMKQHRWDEDLPCCVKRSRSTPGTIWDALRSDPAYANILESRATVLAQLGRIDEARLHMQEAAEFTPDGT